MFSFREKYHSGRKRPSNLRQSASLSALLDQTRHYGNHQPTSARDGSQNSIHVTSDQDSGVNSAVPGDSCDDSPTTFSPIIHTYIAGLKPPAGELNSTNNLPVIFMHCNIAGLKPPVGQQMCTTRVYRQLIVIKTSKCN